jgi:prepilin-type N-terminal cleavage/methylation domain-containing protein
MTSSRRSGFTLVELLVAMTVFSIVIAIATGAFIRALRTQRQLVAFAAANSNVSLVLEQIAREIRVGRDFRQSSDTEITFTNARGEEVTYSFEASGTGSILRSGGVAGPQQLTANIVDVRDLRFILNFSEDDDFYPARVTIAIAVAPKEIGVSTSVVRVQTTVSARNIGT